MIPRHRLQQLWYVPVLGGAMALMMLRTLLMAHLLSVEAFAAFSGGLLVSSTFCMLACLGLQAVLQRDLPVMIVRGRERAGLAMLLQCLGIAAACALVIAGLGTLSSDATGFPPTLLGIGALHGLSQQAFLIATVDSRSRGSPLRFALENLLRALLAPLAGGAAAVAAGSAVQVLLAEALVSIALTYALVGRLPAWQGLRPTVAWRLALRRLQHQPWRSALALLAVTAVAFASINADRWVAATVLGKVDFALYAFAWTVPLVAQSLQSVINASVFPLLARRFASTGSTTAFRISARASIGALVVGAAAAVPAWWMLSSAIVHWFPRYAEATLLLPPLLLVAVLRLSDFWSSYLIIAGFEYRLLVIQLLAAAGGAFVWLTQMRLSTHEGYRSIEVAWLALLLALSSYIAVLVTSVHAHLVLARSRN